ncbi:uncharacterized protein HMPREF1541_07575 [Cyphellophora europaea CBS 101466]|uniref:Xylose isomerase-like TIM barrel domain-containing protein n=1 Tax=Cyphellophora europaea (strain CBS 101466) TaxID=1220924 RepID=W2RNC4_CYPE1|nr:uncharacterized protein HMPREF1541_07575 [Cyphellophora europaea CBS 101466]ETN37952.1 hypothetical protein HMPREF1541_07575 [Cyphellophora europaea CBS 101466]
MAPRFLPAIATQSLGRAPHHPIATKLALIASAGFHAVELFMEDLEHLAHQLRSTSTRPHLTHDAALLAAATHISDLCAHHSLHILCLQPFANYEGLLSPSAHASRLRDLRLWFRLARALRTDLIQIPSSYLPADQCTGERSRVVADLREAADLGLQCEPPVRFAYEALAWGTHADRWEQVWEVVEEVDRVNFGCCLDTFNLLGREWADPARGDGLVPGAEGRLEVVLQRLRTRLDPRKVFYIEAVDGERLDEPLVEGHPFYHEDQPARMSWSRNARLFPCEEKGYLPVVQTLQAIVDAGYEGYVSFEFFSRTAHEQGDHVPREHAERARRSWHRMCEEMGWEDCMKARNIDAPVPSLAQDIGVLSPPPPPSAPALAHQHSMSAALQAH